MGVYEKKKTKKRRIWRVLLLILLVLLAAGGWFAVSFWDEILPAEIAQSVTVEAGSELPPAEDFLLTDADLEIYYLSCPTEEDLTVPGRYAVAIHCGWRDYTAAILVEDTTAPTGVTQNLTVYQYEMPEAADFILEMDDISDITVAYAAEPDENDPDPQTVTILLTDESGNTAELTATLIVIIDDEAPVISGVEDIIVYTGDTVAYRSGVTVTDNLDADITFTVDSSAVDLSTAGEYQVIYSAVDFFGNETTVTATVTVYEKQESYVELDVIYEKVDSLLADILTEGMTDREKVVAIYNWITNNCSYVSYSVKDNWLQAAYRMMVNRYGDCYNYFSLCKLMLERQNIPNIDVVKVPNYEGDSNHYWSLVSVDGGETYYHVDTCPRSVPTYFCLVTDKVIDDFSAWYRNCFNRDKSLYPATPEE